MNARTGIREQVIHKDEIKEIKYEKYSNLLTIK